MDQKESDTAPNREQRIKEGTECLLQHFEYLMKQASERRCADFVEPCITCAQVEQCRCNWLERIKIFCE